MLSSKSGSVVGVFWRRSSKNLLSSSDQYESVSSCKTKLKGYKSY